MSSSGEIQTALCKLLMVIAIFGVVGARDYITGSVRFTLFNREQQEWITLSSNDSDFDANGCNPKEPFAVIVHGWREGTYTEWINDMKNNLTTYRRGCVMFMSYANDNRKLDYFGELVPYFKYLANELYTHLRRLESIGFDPATGYMFGFSFGAHLAIEAGRRLGLKKLERLDVCDPAGPGFDSDGEYSLLDPREAAKRVQCIHTSTKYGTSRRNCHTNWSMGNCGKDQPGAGKYPKGSHGLCPHFYNSAFEHDFYAVPKPDACSSVRYTGIWPRGYKMGYFSDTSSDVEGELFSPTTKYYPYNNDTVLNEI
ncbi:pancreatic lipase-related protein 2-like [Malaya genurostris]|uniref:pancreatic lipase-related protein 2-like n=1 Tax=Malaya genurostris TaxID=325434 RepID=UPI0026F3A34D|nr:pancreatic lipase-related protein 2-like [Malaya genurostris]